MSGNLDDSINLKNSILQCNTQKFNSVKNIERTWAAPGSGVNLVYMHFLLLIGTGF